MPPRRSPLAPGGPAPAPVYTVGHSNRPIEEFLGLLKAFSIRRLADLRTIPRSRKNPQFNADALAGSLRRVRVRYGHHPALGGLRRPRPNSPNGGWRNESFRGFADYMLTPEFDRAIESLVLVASAATTVLLCAEAVPWRCHRSLVADALSVRGVPVFHILSRSRANAHTITPWARVRATRLTYPPGPRDDDG